MYSISKKRTRVTGTDSKGKERILFDTSDVYRNKGQIPLHDLEKKPDGSVKVIDIISDAILCRYEKYKTVTGKDSVATGYLAADFILADYIITRPDPLKTVLLDPSENDKDIIHDIIGFFNKENLIIDISSSARSEVFSRNGFDIVIIDADDHIAEQQLRAALYYLSEKGILLMISRDARIFEEMTDLFIKGIERIQIDDKFTILLSNGNNSFRDWVKPVNLDSEYNKLCMEVEELKQIHEVMGEELKKKRQSLLIRINNLTKEAQSQWNLRKKQELIELKERFAEFI